MAQCTVTVSGIVNYGMHNDVNKNTYFGGLKGDRNNLTFGVVEDLGTGSNVTGTLQFRFNSATGAAGYASSSSSAADGAGATQFEQVAIGYNNPMGSVRVGRFTNALGVTDYSVFEDSKYGTNASRAAYGRLSNQIQFTTPAFNGFQAAVIGAQGLVNKYCPGGTTGAGCVAGVDYSAQVQANNNNGSKGVNDFSSIVLNYANGPLALQYADISGVYYEKATRLSGTWNAGWAKFYVGQYNQKHDIKISDTTQKVQSGAVGTTIAATYTGSDTIGLAAHKSTELGVSIPVGQWTARLGRQTNDKDLGVGVSDGSTKVTKTTIGAEYNLSKRTQLQYQRMSVKNGFSPSSNNGLVQGTSTSGYFGDASGSGYFVGIQHSF